MPTDLSRIRTQVNDFIFYDVTDENHGPSKGLYISNECDAEYKIGLEERL